MGFGAQEATSVYSLKLGFTPAWKVCVFVMVEQPQNKTLFNFQGVFSCLLTTHKKIYFLTLNLFC